MSPLFRRFFGAAAPLVLLLATAAPAELQGDCGPIDLVLCVDDTGSMFDAIMNVRQEMPEIIDAAQAASGGDFRVALVTFKDNVRVRHKLDAVPGDVRATILALGASGGNGLPEAHDEALQTIVELRTAAQGCPGSVGDFDVPFRPEALKIVVVITDDAPAGCNDQYTPGVDDVHAHQVALSAASRGIFVASVYIPGTPNDAAARAAMTDYAETTGGSFLEVRDDGRGTGRAITFVLDTCGGERDCVTFDFDTDFRVLGPGVDVSGNFFQAFGIRLSGRSDATLSPGVFTNRQGAPGTETDDLIPISGNFVTTLAVPGDLASSDFGEICVDFVDPSTFMPRPVEYAEVTFLDVEDSTGVMTAYSRPGCAGEVLFRSTVSNRGNGSQAKVSVGRLGSAGEISIGSVKIEFGDASDSAAIDQLCFVFTANRVGVDNDLPPETVIAASPGSTVDLTLRMTQYRDWPFDGYYATIGILRPDSPRRIVKTIETVPITLPPRQAVFKTSRFRIPERWGIRNVGKTVAFGQVLCDRELDYLKADFARVLIVP